MQKSTKQKNTLEAANNSVKLLNEMLAHFSPEGSSDGDKELLQVWLPENNGHWISSPRRRERSRLWISSRSCVMTATSSGKR